MENHQNENLRVDFKKTKAHDLDFTNNLADLLVKKSVHLPKCAPIIVPDFSPKY